MVAPPLPMIAGIISSGTLMEITFDSNSSSFFVTRLLTRPITQRLHFRRSFRVPSFEPFLSNARNTPPASGWPASIALLTERWNSLMLVPDLFSSSLFNRGWTIINSSISSFSKRSRSTSTIASSTFLEGPMTRRVVLSPSLFDKSATTRYLSVMRRILSPVFPTTSDVSLPFSKRDLATIWTLSMSSLALLTLSGRPRNLIRETLDNTSIITSGFPPLILLRTADCCDRR
mmetsp:Transcript_26457/g.56285  ORF Transcript_26457/g.56285 Transcript_26457/m.56285 type:complete len:231 (+) Transcript_26457:524-1216(+)